MGRVAPDSSDLAPRPITDASGSVTAKRSLRPLQRGCISLRLLEEQDLPLTLQWRNDNAIRRWFRTSDIITPEGHAAWFRQYQDMDNDFVFLIEETSALGRPVGQASLYHVDWQRKRAEFGRLMIGHPAARGLGLGRLATEILVDLALEEWGLQEVYLEVLPSNERALAIYRAIGFRQTGEAGLLVPMNLFAAGRRP